MGAPERFHLQLCGHVITEKSLKQKLDEMQERLYRSEKNHVFRNGQQTTLDEIRSWLANADS
jgi:hypothetical protein